MCGALSLPCAVPNVITRDASLLLLPAEREKMNPDFDVVLSLLKVRILHRYGGWMCDPDVMWLGRHGDQFNFIPPGQTHLAVVATVASQGQAIPSSCFMGVLSLLNFGKSANRTL